MRSVSIRRMQAKKKKYANCVYICVRRGDREREKLSVQKREREAERK